MPITMVGAGLPQLVGQVRRAKSYAERLFEFASIDRLDDAAAQAALTIPAGNVGVAYTSSAVAKILRQTRGYPSFLQEWG